jgi:hypothetical protein
MEYLDPDKSGQPKTSRGQRDHDFTAKVGKAPSVGVPTDEAAVLEALQVPAPLQSHECNRLLAKSVLEAFRAVEQLTHQQPGHGGLDINRKPVPAPMVQTYGTNSLYAPNGLGSEGDLRYAARPLVPRQEGPQQLKELWFAQEEALGRDLRARGFTERRLDEIWAAKRGGGPARQPLPRDDGADQGQPSWREITERIWKLLQAHQELWRQQSIGQIGHQIYQHAYLGAPLAEPQEGRDLASSERHRYVSELRKVFEDVGEALPRQSEGFYHLGSATDVRFRLYLHASRATAPAVFAAVLAKRSKTKEIVYVKVAAAEDAGQRPDTIVVYVSGERATAESIAKELHGDLKDGVLEEEIPAFTAGGDGIGMAWDPQGTTDLSFGEYLSAILAEAFFDVIAGERFPDAAMYHRRVLEFFTLYGLSEDVMIAALSGAELEFPPTLAKPTEAHGSEGTCEHPEWAPRSSPALGERARGPKLSEKEEPRSRPRPPGAEGAPSGGAKFIPTFQPLREERATPQRAPEQPRSKDVPTGATNGPAKGANVAQLKRSLVIPLGSMSPGQQGNLSGQLGRSAPGGAGRGQQLGAQTPGAVPTPRDAKKPVPIPPPKSAKPTRKPTGDGKHEL